MAPGPEHIALAPETKNRMTRRAVTLERLVVQVDSARIELRRRTEGN